jgi:alkaline phosphatase
MFICLVGRDGDGPGGPSLNLPLSGKTAKYVFFFIGDGMGIPQRTSTEMYLDAKDGKAPRHQQADHEHLPRPRRHDHLCRQFHHPDSADTATAMACGVKTNSGMLGVTPDGKAVTNVRNGQGKRHEGRHHLHRFH